MTSVLDYYDTIGDYLSSIAGRIDARIELAEASGHKATFADLLERFQNNKDIVDNYEEELFSYITGISRDTQRSVEEVTNDLRQTVNGNQFTNDFRDSDLIAKSEDLYKEYLGRSANAKEIRQFIADINQEIKQESNKDVKKTLLGIRAEYKKWLSETALSKAETKYLNQLQKNLGTINNILGDDSYYNELVEKTQELEDRQFEAELIQQDIDDVNQQLAEARADKDKEQVVDLKKQLTNLQKQLKATRLTGKEQKLLDANQEKIRVNELMDNIADDRGKYYLDALTKRDQLLQKQAEYDKAVRFDDKSLQKKNKLTSKEKDLLYYLNENIESLDKLYNESMVDNAVANTAQYKKLINDIGTRQESLAKDPNNIAKQKDLNMLLEMLDAINQGVLAEDLTAYINNYKKWWKAQDSLDKNGKISAKANDNLAQYTKIKEGFENNYKKYVKNLEFELQQAQINADDSLEMLELNYEKSIEELTDVYDERTQDIIDDLHNNKTYRAKKSRLEYLKQLKELGKLRDESELNMLTELIDALETGGTSSNISEYIKAFSYKYKYQSVHDAGGSARGYNAATWDKYVNMLNAWDEEKQNELDLIQKELEDQLKQLETEYEKQTQEIEAKIFESKTAVFESAKEIAEYQITSLEQTLEILDAMVEKYKEVAHLLESTTMENIAQYKGLAQLLGIDTDSSVTDALREQLVLGMQQSKAVIETQLQKADLLKALIDAGDANSFQGIFDLYMETADEAMRETINELVEFLNSNDFTDSEWIAEWNQMLSDTASKIVDSIGGLQDLKEELRENVIFKAIDNAIAQLDSLNSRLSSMANVIKDEWTTDVNGLTEYGAAKAAVLAEQYHNAQEQVANYADKIRAIQEAQANEESQYATEEEYMQALNEAYENYYSAIVDVEDVATSLYELSKKQQEAEINQLKNVINLRKEALTNKKAYYDYDKNLKAKTKDVEALEAEIRALNDVNTAEAKALKKQREMALSDAKDALDDLKMQHQFDLSTQALDKFIADLESTLDDSTQTIDETFEKFLEGLQSILEVAKEANVNGTYNKVTRAFLGTDADIGPLQTDLVSDHNTSTQSNATPTNASSGYIPISTSDFIKSISTLRNDLTQDFVPIMNTSNNTLSNMYNSLTDINDGIRAIVDALSNEQPVDINLTFDNKLTVNGGMTNGSMTSAMHNILEQNYQYTRDRLFKELRSIGFIKR